jgi:glutamate decarboxylase
MALPLKTDSASMASNAARATNFPSQPLPKTEFPPHSVDPTIAYQLVHDELLLDGNSRQNLATFCQTWVEPQVRKLMDECLDKNMVDKDEYPQTTEIESRCIRMLSDIWNSPDVNKSVGCSTAGSSEAAILCGLAMKLKWRTKRAGLRRSAGGPNLICGPVHVCWRKFAKFFDVELRQIPCEGQRLMMSAAEVLKRCDENTIGVVPTLGLTYTLKYEPVREVALALDDLEEQHGLDIPMHVDAASGGFVAPFIHSEVEWDFRIPRVKSINTSGHKFGLSPLGCGWAIWKEACDLPEEMIFHVKVLGGNMSSIGLNFSRPGGQVISQYYNFVRLGREGYRKITESCTEVGSWVSDEVEKLGPFTMIYDGRGGLPGCCWTLNKETARRFSLYDLADRLRVRGWQVPAYPMPADRTNLVVQRVLARFGLSRDLAGLLVEDIKRALRHLDESLSGQSLTRQQAGGYYHA